MGGITLTGQLNSSSRSAHDLSFFKGRRVLLVEDNLINQTVARKVRVTNTEQTPLWVPIVQELEFP